MFSLLLTHQLWPTSGDVWCGQASRGVFLLRKYTQNPLEMKSCARSLCGVCGVWTQLMFGLKILDTDIGGIFLSTLSGTLHLRSDAALQGV